MKFSRFVGFIVGGSASVFLTGGIVLAQFASPSLSPSPSPIFTSSPSTAPSPSPIITGGKGGTTSSLPNGGSTELTYVMILAGVVMFAFGTVKLLGTLRD